MAVTVGVNQRSVVHKGSSGVTIAFPDVCKTPDPHSPVPIPYPPVQYQENLKKANKVDGNAKAGGKFAKRRQQQAIDNLKAVTGMTVKSATKAVMMGYTVHKQGQTQRTAFTLNQMSIS